MISAFIESAQFAILSFSSIIAIMNPVSTAAVFTALSEEMTDQERRQVILDAMKISLIVLLFFALTGEVIFTIFGLTVPAFKIAGGILLISVAIGMLHGKKETYSGEELENIAVAPLAFPLTCGAGTITTVILLASHAGNIFDTVIVFFAIGAAVGVSYLALKYSSLIFRFIGDTEVRAIMKLLSILVLAIAVQFILSGVGDAMVEIISAILAYQS